MIDCTLIADAMRRRVICATGIDPLKQYRIDNTNINPAGLDFWIAEYVIGGTEQLLSTQRSMIPAFLIQYDLMVPVNAGILTLEEKSMAICNEFALDDTERSSVYAGNMDIMVRSIRAELDFVKDWKRKILLFTLAVVGS